MAFERGDAGGDGAGEIGFGADVEHGVVLAGVRRVGAILGGGGGANGDGAAGGRERCERGEDGVAQIGRPGFKGGSQPLSGVCGDSEPLGDGEAARDEAPEPGGLAAEAEAVAHGDVPEPADGRGHWSECTDPQEIEPSVPGIPSLTN